MPLTVVVGLLLIVGASCLFLGAWLGYFTAVTDAERKHKRHTKRLEEL